MSDQTFAWQKKDLKELDGNYIDELSAEWLYNTLAEIDDQKERAIFLRELAEYEKKHAKMMMTIMEGIGHPIPRAKHPIEQRIVIGLARIVGVGPVIPILHKAEVDGIAKYKRQKDRWKDPKAQAALNVVLPEEVAHEIDLFGSMRESTASTGVLRSAILGVNDGLGSILALVAGVAGATSSSQAVLIAGIAGLVAGAVSMAASNYVSVKAEQEVYSSQVSLQSQAIEVAPDEKKSQLKAAYREKGLTDIEADNVVNRLASNKEEFLKTLLAEKQGIAISSFEKPGRLALYTGLAFILAGLIPVLPFIGLVAFQGIIMSVALTCTALFFAGIVRALSTLKSFLRSGVEMLLFGIGAAIVTYLIGFLVGGIA